MLIGYPDYKAANELYTGFSEGFRLQYTGPRQFILTRNLISAEQYKNETLAKLSKEISLGRMLGPFHTLPISTLRVSPIGLVPKSDGTWRLITHLSFPPGNSINDFISEEFCKVKYSSLDNILDVIYELGRGALLGKIDIKSAFRLLIVNPADFDLLGIFFDGKFYIDKCLPFGCSISPNLFEKFSTFLQWAVKISSGLDTLDHYLDDFIFMGSKYTSDCLFLMNTFMGISEELGIPIADDKTVGPTTVLPYLGFIIDTELMMVLIPPDKISKLHDLLVPMLNKRKMLVRDLESVTGLMSYCSRAIPSSRAFIRRFYDLLSSIKNRKPLYKVRINNEVKADVTMWLQFLHSFNGQCLFPEKNWLSNHILQLFTDSSGNPGLGCGAYFCGHWVQFPWPIQWHDLPLMRNLALLELIPIVLALYLWAPHLSQKRIIFRTDNIALVSIINKRSSKDKQIMKLIRPLVLLTMRHHIQFKAFHIEGAQNQIADALSRFQVQRFRSLAPAADLLPATIPGEFLTVISNL